MIKRLGKAALGEAKFRYVTALTDPQIRGLLAQQRLQLDLFDEKPAEVELDGKRYVLRCNPQTQARERARRADQWARVQAKITARNAKVETKPRTDPASSLKQAQGLLSKYRLGGWVKVQLTGRKMVWTEDEAARTKQAELDGCYVIESDLPKEVASTQQVHDRYLDLTQVERDFRTLKTGLLEMRPIFLRKAKRTRGHTVVSLLALKLARELDRRCAPLGLTVGRRTGATPGAPVGAVGEQRGGVVALADKLSAGAVRSPGSAAEAEAAPVISKETQRPPPYQPTQRPRLEGLAPGASLWAIVVHVAPGRSRLGRPHSPAPRDRRLLACVPNTVPIIKFICFEKKCFCGW